MSEHVANLQRVKAFLLEHDVYRDVEEIAKSFDLAIEGLLAWEAVEALMEKPWHLEMLKGKSGYRLTGIADFYQTPQAAILAASSPPAEAEGT